MSDPSQTPDPSCFEDTAGFRESTIYLFPPEEAELLRRFGRLLHELILEGRSGVIHEKPLTRLELEAAHADLLHLRDFLRYIGQREEEDQLDKYEARLSRFAGEIVEELERISERFAQVLAAPAPARRS